MALNEHTDYTDEIARPSLLKKLATRLSAGNFYTKRPRTQPDLNEASAEKFILPRIFSSAGDDVAKFGTVVHLQRFLTATQENALEPSWDKIIISRKLLKYCERVLFKTDQTSILSQIGKDPYEEHLLVDTIKVRLLSPVAKAQDSAIYRNPAIGKGQLLVKEIANLPETWSPFKEGYVLSRFLRRMWSHVPKLGNGHLNPIILLPTMLGGLGLGPPIGGINPYAELSEPHMRVLLKTFQIGPSSKDSRLLKSLTSNFRARGLDLDDTWIDNVIEYLALNLHPCSLERAEQDCGLNRGRAGYFQRKANVLSMGYISDMDLRGLFSRADLQRRLLCGEPKSNDWGDTPWEGKLERFNRNILNFIEGKPEYQFSSDEIEIGRIDLFQLTAEDQESWISRFWVPEVFFRFDPDCNSQLGDPGYVVEQLLASNPRLELPPLIQRGWFPSQCKH